MNPANFEQANHVFGPPSGYDESQVQRIPAYVGQIVNPASSVDGQAIVVVAWKPSDAEIRQLIEGAPVYLCCFGGIPPHCIGTSFESVTHIK